MAHSQPSVRSSTPTLLRQLGLVSATALVISNMIGTGIFSASGFLAGDLGRPDLLLLIWVVGAVVALLGAFCYSELGINLPSSGGEYVYLTRAYGPAWGFMSGWTSFFAGFSGPIAAAALAFSGYLGYFFPFCKQDNVLFQAGSGDWVVHVGGAQITAGVLIGLFTALNCFGVARVARIQNVLTGGKITVLLCLVIGGLLFGAGDWHNFSVATTRTSTTPLGAQFAISLFWIYVSYSGWNAATYIAEELKQPSRTLPMALAIGTAAVALLYLAINVVFVYSTPLGQMKGVMAIGALSASRLFGPNIAGVFAGLMALSLVSTVNAMVTIGPRTYYAMAKNGAFFASAARVHPVYRTPVLAIVSQGVCAMLMTLIPFGDLLQYIGWLLNFFTALTVSSLFLFRRRPDWQRLRIVSFLWPLLPTVFILVGAWITLYGLRFNLRVSLGAGATIALGALVYHLRFARTVAAAEGLVSSN